MAGKGQAEGCAACAKWLLIIFNVLFCLFGIGLLAAGIYTYIELRQYLNFLGNENINIPGIMLIVFGCITFIIAALGCIGACKESPCLLFTFAAIIGVLLVAEIVVGIVAFIYRDTIEEKIDEYGPEVLNDKYKNGTTPEGVAAFYNLIQNRLDCCGIEGPADWGTEKPPSCYENPDKMEGLKTEGCKDGAKMFIKNNVYVVGGVALGFGIIELLGIVFACCVGCAARKGEYA